MAAETGRVCTSVVPVRSPTKTLSRRRPRKHQHATGSELTLPGRGSPREGLLRLILTPPSQEILAGEHAGVTTSDTAVAFVQWVWPSCDGRGHIGMGVVWAARPSLCREPPKTLPNGVWGN